MTRIGDPSPGETAPDASSAPGAAPVAVAPSPRYNGIQALRFVAALLVVVTHSTLYARERLNSSWPVWEFGVVGVEIFFLISGFVMVSSTRKLQGQKDGWKYFGMRRLVRIVPMYWIATTVKIATMLVLPGAVLHAALTPSRVIFSYLFLPSRNVDGRVEPLLSVGWTLTFEMFFYLIFTIALLLRSNTVILAGSVLVLCALASFFRPSGQYPPAEVYFDPIVLYFLIGMLIAKIAVRRHARRELLIVFAVLAVATAVVALVSGPTLNTSRSSLFTILLLSALVVAVVWLEPLVSDRIPRFVLFMGAASYTLYLFHPMVAPIVPVVLGHFGLKNEALSVVLSVLVAIAAAALIYRIVEKPVTKWLTNRLPYVRTKPARDISEQVA